MNVNEVTIRWLNRLLESPGNNISAVANVF